MLAVLDYTAENLAISRSAAGNISFDILIDETGLDQILFYEIGSLQKHSKPIWFGASNAGI